MTPFLALLLITFQTEAPVFRIESVSETPTTGRLVRFSRENSAILSTDKGEMNITDVVSVRRINRTLPPLPTGPHLITANGDRIAGTIVGGDDRLIRFLPSGYPIKPEKAWEIPLSSARILWLIDLPAEMPLDPSRYDWLVEAKNVDVLRLRNQDILLGSLERFDALERLPTLTFRPRMGESRQVPVRELATIAFNPALSRIRRPKGEFVQVVLTDGSRLTLENAALKNGTLTATPTFGGSIELPLDAIAALEVRGGKAMYLSDLRPKAVEQSGFLGIVWPFAADRTVNGESLRIQTANGESTVDKGLCTFPRAVLMYNLGGRYRRFESLVGLTPDSRTVRSLVSVKVLVDGKGIANEPLTRLANGLAIPVRVDINGANELTLVVEFAREGGVRSEVIWADARLIE